MGYQYYSARLPKDRLGSLKEKGVVSFSNHGQCEHANIISALMAGIEKGYFR